LETKNACVIGGIRIVADEHQALLFEVITDEL